METGEGDADSILSQQKGCTSKCDSVRFLGMLYVGGLTAIAVAGVGAPSLFIEKESIPEIPSEYPVSSAEADHVFHITNYKRAHQSIFLSTRLNLPVQLQETMNVNETSELETAYTYNVTAYGSEQSEVLSDPCLTGCISCPDGNEELGLTCELIASDSVRRGTISCTEGDDWCTWSTLYSVDFVHHRTYYWGIEAKNDLDSLTAEASTKEPWVSEFRVVFVSQWFTGFEMVWFYFWTTVTLLVMFFPTYGFFSGAMRKGVPWHKWSRQQKWVGVLLVALLFYNNPFFAAQIFSSHSREFFIWFSVAEGLLVALLLRYWLDRLFDLGRSSQASRSKEGLARFAQWMLAILIFVVYVVNMIQIRLSRDEHPEHIHRYPSNSTSGELGLTALCFVYCAWVVMLSARAWWWGAGGESISTSPRVVFFLATSTVSVMVLIPSIILEHLSPRVRGGAAFTIGHGAPSLYILAMALLSTPRTDQPQPVDSIASGGAVNSMHQPPLPEVGGEEDFAGPRSQRRSPWWQPKARPKIADSSVWEDVHPGTA